MGKVEEFYKSNDASWDITNEDLDIIREELKSFPWVYICLFPNDTVLLMNKNFLRVKVVNQNRSNPEQNGEES